MKYRLSIDQEVKVKLTSKDKAIVQSLLYTLVERPAPQDNYLKLKEDKDGYVTMTLWQAITYFPNIREVYLHVE